MKRNIVCNSPRTAATNGDGRPEISPDAMERESARIRRRFNRMAAYYDVWEVFLAPLRRKVVRVAHLPTEARVLDVGTGTGRQALAFAAAGCRVTGIDPAQKMIAAAKRNDPRGRVRFLIADGTDMPFDDNSFDAACVSLTLHELLPEIRLLAVAEMVRVTRPGGRMIVVDVAYPPAALCPPLLFALASLFDRHYKAFVTAGPQITLGELGVEIDRTARFWSGLGRIWTGTVR